MNDVGIIHGDESQAVPLVIGKTTVYVHTDIKKVEVENPDGSTSPEWQYHEVQYSKDEYLKKISKEKDKLDSQTTALQLGLVESYEQSLQAQASAEQQVTDLQTALVELYESLLTPEQLSQ